MIRPRFSRVDLDQLAKVLGIEAGGLSDRQLLDAVSDELAKKKAILRLDPAGDPPTRTELEGGYER